MYILMYNLNFNFLKNNFHRSFIVIKILSEFPYHILTPSNINSSNSGKHDFSNWLPGSTMIRE